MKKLKGMYMNSNNPSYQKADAVFFGVSMDLTCSYNKGTAKAPGEILKALGQIEFEPSLSAEQLNDLIEIYSEGIIQAGKVKGRKAVEAEVEKVLKEIELVSEKAVKNNKFFFCFGGEHLVSLGAVRGIAKIIEPKETRTTLIKCLEMLLSKREKRMPKKHANIPL